MTGGLPRPTRLIDAVEALRPAKADTREEQQAQAYYERRSARLLALRMHVARYLVRSGAPQPRVAVLEAVAPPRSAGLWVPDMIDAAGGVALHARPGEPGIAVNPADLGDADALVVGIPGASPEVALAQATALLHAPEWSALSAVVGGRVWFVDYTRLFAAPDERLIEGVEMLIRMILPEALGSNGTPPPAHLAVPMKNEERGTKN